MAMTREVSRRPRGTALTGTRPGPVRAGGAATLCARGLQTTVHHVPSLYRDDRVALSTRTQARTHTSTRTLGNMLHREDGVHRTELRFFRGPWWGVSMAPRHRGGRLWLDLAGHTVGRLGSRPWRHWIARRLPWARRPRVGVTHAGAPWACVFTRKRCWEVAGRDSVKSHEDLSSLFQAHEELLAVGNSREPCDFTLMSSCHDSEATFPRGHAVGMWPGQDVNSNPVLQPMQRLLACARGWSGHPGNTHSREEWTEAKEGTPPGLPTSPPRHPLLENT